jgi:thymidylate synthase (FAD)
MGEVTQKVVLLRHTEEPEQVVAMAAKLCYSPATVEELRGRIQEKEQRAFVQRLAEMGHHSPLEHASFTFAIEGISRVTSHQLVRHRLASYSQQSQRYVGEHSSREGGLFDFVVPPSVVAAGRREWYLEKMTLLQQWYDDLTEALGNQGESSNEDARFLLPNAAETKIIVTMNARELRHFFQVRCCRRAQWEIRGLATEMLRLAVACAPALFAGAGPGCLEGACPEGRMTCGRADEVRKEFRELLGG